VDELKSSINSIEGVKSIDGFHLWSLDGIDSVLTLKLSIDNFENRDEIKKEIYNMSFKYHIVDITVEFN
jgi:cobalt-zinc-cadmium efflux system protein